MVPIEKFEDVLQYLSNIPAHCTKISKVEIADHGSPAHLQCLGDASSKMLSFDQDTDPNMLEVFAAARKIWRSERRSSLGYVTWHRGLQGASL
ncbi:MAG: hypothetical protein R3A45_04800 [Bdellovibrionota bacterium]